MGAVRVEFDEEAKRIERLLSRDGKENPYDIKAELRLAMDQHFGVYRTGESMQKGLDKIKELKKRYENVKITDRSLVYNTDLVMTLELENLLDVAEVVAMGALNREESRGAHSRRDFPKRDDEKWLKHTVVYRNEDGSLRIDYMPVNIIAWKPVERKY